MSTPGGQNSLTSREPIAGAMPCILFDYVAIGVLIALAICAGVSYLRRKM